MPKLNDKPAWLLPMVVLISSFGFLFVAGIYFLFVMNASDRVSPVRLSPSLADPVSGADLAPSLPPQSATPIDQQSQVDSSVGDGSDNPPIEYQRCVVTLVKAFDYSFDRASESCKK